MPRPALLALALLATGCFRGASPDAAPPAAAPADARGFLVWSDDGVTRVTRWLDARGQERGRADGAWLAHDGALWRLDQRGAAASPAGCKERDDGTVEPGEASFEALVMDARAADRHLTLVRPDLARADGAASYAHTARARASLGPLVFGEERVDAFACGAHGSLGVSAFVFDARVGAQRPVPERPAGPALAPAIAAAVAAATEGGAPIDPLDASSTWRIVETLPRWADGALGARHLAVIDACYACTTGEWSSYSASVWVDAPRPPAAWAALAREVPAPVARALAAERADAAGVSWGVVDAAWAATFAAR